MSIEGKKDNAQTPAVTPAREAGQTSAAKPRKPRGFAVMDRRLVSQIASKGGKAAHKAGRAHEFTSDEAREAGKKGGPRPAKKEELAVPSSDEAAPSSAGDHG